MYSDILLFYFNAGCNPLSIFLDPLMGQDPQFGKHALEHLPNSPSSQGPCLLTSCTPSQHTGTYRTPHASPLPLTPGLCHLLGNMVRPRINPALVKVSLPPILHLLPLRKTWPEKKTAQPRALTSLQFHTQ